MSHPTRNPPLIIHWRLVHETKGTLRLVTYLLAACRSIPKSPTVSIQSLFFDVREQKVSTDGSDEGNYRMTLPHVLGLEVGETMVVRRQERH